MLATQLLQVNQARLLVSSTGTGTPVYMSITAAVDGVFSAVIHYDEVSLNNGDLTRIDTVAAIN